MYLCGKNNEKTIIMRKITLILAFLAIVAYGATQDFLTPNSYGIYNYFDNGNETLFRLLITSEKSDASTTWEGGRLTFYLCTPSFSPEYALVIGENQLVLNKAKESIWLYITAIAYIQDPTFNKRDKEQRKQIRYLANSMKSNPVNSFTMSITKEQSKCITTLFDYATQTASHLQRLNLGLDGTTYYFNHWRKLACVWAPQSGRTAQLATMADSLCYAVEHNDTVVLNQQLEVCKKLIRSFKKEFPLSYFKNTRFTYHANKETGIWHCELVGGSREVFMQLDILSDFTINSETGSKMLRQYSDSLASWSREIFLMSDNPYYPSIVIDNHADTAICLAKQQESGVRQKITIPETYWSREVILSAAQLPPGRYYFAEGEWRKQ